MKEVIKKSMQTKGDRSKQTGDKKKNFKPNSRQKDAQFQTLDLGQGNNQTTVSPDTSSQFKTLDLNLGQTSPPKKKMKHRSAPFGPIPGQIPMSNFRTLDLGKNPKGNPEKKGPMFYHYLLNDYNAMKYYQTDIYDQDFIKLERYDDISKLKCAFPSISKMNDAAFNIKKIKHAKFFVLRSTCDDDIHKAIKYGIWTSTYKNNLILNDLFRKYRRDNTPIFLIFTVVGSGQYCGLARMASEVELKKTFSYWWEEVKWSGVFKINWIYVKDVLYEEVSDILLPNGNKIISCKDGSELDFTTGLKMLEKFKYSIYVSDIFEFFNFMDNREEKIRMKRDSMNQIIESLKIKGLIPPVPPKSSKRKRRMDRKRNNKYMPKYDKPKHSQPARKQMQQPGFMGMPPYRGQFGHPGMAHMGQGMRSRPHPGQMMGGHMPYSMPMYPSMGMNMNMNMNMGMGMDMNMMRMGYPPNMRYMAYHNQQHQRPSNKPQGLNHNLYGQKMEFRNKSADSKDEQKTFSKK